MTSVPAASDSETRPCQPHYDAIIIGGGLSGLRALYEVRKQGLRGQAFEAGGGIGGTWYRNRYPGARTDAESWVYTFSFLNDIGLVSDSKERFLQQAEVEEYLNRLADHLQLRHSIQLNTTVTTALRDEERNLWIVKTSDGGNYTCDFLITGTGPLATPIEPPFPGLGLFKGDWFLTGKWPTSKVDFMNKRVALVGTGASGVQIVPVVAQSAKQLTVFQRTPNYIVPGQNHSRSPQTAHDFEKSKQQALAQQWGLDIKDSRQMYQNLKHDPDEVQRVLERGWEAGGFHFIFKTFNDLLLSEESNRVVADFIRHKIRMTVNDPKTAELLCPDYPLVAKRPLIGHHYFEAYNRANVRLVDIKNNEIQAITPTGLRTDSEEFEFDIIIFALGFNAVVGTLEKIDIRNSKNDRLGDVLSNRLETNLGITVSGFPNLFMVLGPQSAYANAALVIDITADWFGRTIAWMRYNKNDRCESTREGALQWSERVRAAYNALIVAKKAGDVSNWITGSNVANKEVTPVFYFGGIPAFNAALNQEIQDDYPGHTFTTMGAAVRTA